MATATKSTSVNPVNLETALKGVLNSIEREREREIVSRRFGLYERRETLEQIGELLNITRERVRQLEKAAIIRLKTATAGGQLSEVKTFEKAVLAIFYRKTN